MTRHYILCECMFNRSQLFTIRNSDHNPEPITLIQSLSKDNKYQYLNLLQNIEDSSTV